MLGLRRKNRNPEKWRENRQNWRDKKWAKILTRRSVSNKIMNGVASRANPRYMVFLSGLDWSDGQTKSGVGAERVKLQHSPRVKVPLRDYCPTIVFSSSKVGRRFMYA
ncbi:MAG: hypothetical protein QXH20_02965 [Candidatus Bathyarchaeia archaeon]